MTSRASWTLVALVAACSRTPASSGRERVLAKLPARTVAILTAAGPTLAHPRFRPVLDALRSEIPASLGCVADAALAADHVAVGLGPDRSVTIVLETGAPVRCRALSHVGDVWVATLGSGTLAAGPGDSALTAPQLARYRSYLVSSPVAFVDVEGHLLATAQAEPLEAWLALDGSDPDATETRVRGELAQLAGDPAAAAVASHVMVSRDGTQVLARLERGASGDLAIAVRAWLVRHAVRAATTDRFACPPTKPPVIACTGDTTFEVATLEAALELVRAAPSAPHIAGGSVAGMRLGADIPELGLRTGDVIVGIAGRTIASRRSFDEALARGKRPAELIVQRGTLERAFVLREAAP